RNGWNLLATEAPPPPTEANSIRGSAPEGKELKSSDGCSLQIVKRQQFEMLSDFVSFKDRPSGSFIIPGRISYEQLVQMINAKYQFEEGWTIQEITMMISQPDGSWNPTILNNNSLEWIYYFPSMSMVYLHLSLQANTPITQFEDRFIDGLYPAVRHNIVGHGTQTYARAVSIAQEVDTSIRREAVRGQTHSSAPAQSSSVPPMPALPSTQPPKNNKRKEKGAPADKRARRTLQQIPQCPTCGRLHRGECRFGQDVCYYCHERGHFANHCPKKAQQPQQPPQQPQQPPQQQQP
ncbi:Unknown protein, partial [Striga hermonthica]